jgi:hypothetical protein
MEEREEKEWKTNNKGEERWRGERREENKREEKC